MSTSKPIIEHEVLPRNVDFDISSSENSWRIKIFWQNAEGTWDEGGTGYCQIVRKVGAQAFLQNEGYFVVVKSDLGADAGSDELLHSEILQSKTYRQQKGALTSHHV